MSIAERYRALAADRKGVFFVDLRGTSEASSYSPGASMALTWFDQHAGRLEAGRKYIVGNGRGSGIVTCRQGAVGPYLPGVGHAAGSSIAIARVEYIECPE